MPMEKKTPAQLPGTTTLLNEHISRYTNPGATRWSKKRSQAEKEWTRYGFSAIQSRKAAGFDVRIAMAE